MYKTKLIVLILGCLSITMSYSQSLVDRYGLLKVCGNNLCDSKGNKIQLAGMSTHGIQWHGWKDCLTEKSLDILANDWKADVVRIAMYVQEGGYESNPDRFTKQVNDLIEEISNRGMYIIVDWHILKPGDPNFNLKKAKEFFTKIVTKNKHRNNIIYEICNEPNGINWKSIKKYANKIIPVIRSIDPTSLILVGTPDWSSLGVSGNNDPGDIIKNPLKFKNVMYTFHFYTKSHTDLYLKELDKASDQIPIFVTEFGTQEYSGDGENDFEMAQQFIDLMKRKKISWVNWNYSDNELSGASWEKGTCAEKEWTIVKLKPSGEWVRNQLILRKKI